MKLKSLIMLLLLGSSFVLNASSDSLALNLKQEQQIDDSDINLILDALDKEGNNAPDSMIRNIYLKTGIELLGTVGLPLFIYLYHQIKGQELSVDTQVYLFNLLCFISFAESVHSIYKNCKKNQFYEVNLNNLKKKIIALSAVKSKRKILGALELLDVWASFGDDSFALKFFEVSIPTVISVYYYSQCKETRFLIPIILNMLHFIYFAWANRKDFAAERVQTIDKIKDLLGDKEDLEVNEQSLPGYLAKIDALIKEMTQLKIQLSNDTKLQALQQN